MSEPQYQIGFVKRIRIQLSEQWQEVPYRAIARGSMIVTAMIMVIVIAADLALIVYWNSTPDPGSDSGLKGAGLTLVTSPLIALFVYGFIVINGTMLARFGRLSYMNVLLVTLGWCILFSIIPNAGAVLVMPIRESLLLFLMEAFACMIIFIPIAFVWNLAVRRVAKRLNGSED